MRRLGASFWAACDLLERWVWLICAAITAWMVFHGDPFGAAIWGALTGVQYMELQESLESPNPPGQITFTGQWVHAEVTDQREFDKAYGGTD